MKNNELIQTKNILNELQEYVRQNNLSITVDLVGEWLWCYGEDTKEHKEFIKSLGFRWAKNKGKWYYHEKPYFKASKKQFTYEEIKELNGSQRVI